MIEKISDNSLFLEKKFSIIKKGRIENDLINNPFSNYYVYKIDNKIVAFINYDIIYERIELVDIYVLEEYRNQKIATKLIEKMLEDATNNNVKSISLEVRKDNEKAIKLYNKFDFKEVAIRKNYYHMIDGILMEKKVK